MNILNKIGKMDISELAEELVYWTELMFLISFYIWIINVFYVFSQS